MPEIEARTSKVRNQLVAALPDEEYYRLLPRFEAVTLTLKELTASEGQPLEYAWFPENCVISILAQADADSFIEIATVGCEGMVGTSLILGIDTTPHRSFCQIPGECLRMPAEALRAEVARGGPFVSILQHYMQALIVQVAQAAACNGRHTIEQRCARWLLMCRDRVDSDEFPLTQEFLCQMLAVRRASVSEIASRFQEAGLIRYTRGRVAILDRKGLERIACECYRIIREEHSRPLPAPRGRGENEDHQ